MGMPHAQVGDNMMVVDMVDLRNTMKGEKGDWRQILMRYVKNVHDEMPFDLFVLDSLESFKGLAQFDFSRQHMMDLFDWFKSLNITVMAIAERPIEALECSKQGETYLADGVIELQLKEFDNAKVYRWLRCTKMRGMQIDPRFYAFYHTGQEFKFSLPLVVSGS
jgi:KaiC/GvpD/RAD55 family RecA-like ATPase